MRKHGRRAAHRIIVATIAIHVAIHAAREKRRAQSLRDFMDIVSGGASRRVMQLAGY